MGHYTFRVGDRYFVRDAAPNGHTVRRSHLNQTLFPDQPTGPFCYVRQGRHDRPFNKRDTKRRAERRFRLKDKFSALDEGDLRCTHID